MKTQWPILKVIACIALLFHANYTHAIEHAPISTQPKAELTFIKNKGQIRNENDKIVEQVLYYTQVKSSAIFFQKNAVSYIQYNTSDPSKPSAHKIDVEFLNSNQDVEITTSHASAGIYNFYRSGNANGITNVEGYQTLTYHNLYPDIDLEYKIENNSVKYDIIIHPGADISDIQFKVDGATAIEVKDHLVDIQTSLGNITDEIPISYYDDEHQTRVDFIHLTKKNNIISFEQVSNNVNKTLVIDPVLTFFNNFGPVTINGAGTGNGVSSGNAIKHGTNGDITIVGQTNTLTFYMAPGGVYGSLAADRAFISHFNSAGVMQWSSTVESYGNTLTFTDVSPDVSLYMVCGTTNSTVLPGAANSYNGGSSDGFVCQFNGTGTLVSSWYIGGNYEDGTTCITDAGTYYGYFVGGYSFSALLNGTLTGYPYNGIPNTTKDGFVYIIKPDNTPGLPPFFSEGHTFMGAGDGDDEVTDLDFIYSNNTLAVTGTTYTQGIWFSPSITTVIGSNLNSGDRDIFAINFALPQIHPSHNFYSNCAATIGTDGNDEYLPKLDIRYDASASAVNNYHLSFITKSAGLNAITTANAYQKNITGSVYNNFYISLSPTLASVNYATYFYPAVTSPVVSPFCVKVDWLGNIFLAATTSNPTLPYTNNNTVSGTGLPGTPATNNTDIMIVRLNADYTLGFLTLTGNTSADQLAEMDVTRQQEVTSCKTLVYLTGVTTTNTGVSYAIDGVVTDDNPVTIFSSNGNSLPTTLSIPNLGALNSGPITIQWYFNGMPYFPDPLTSVGGGQSIYANLPGDYYVTISYGGCVFQTQTVHFGYDCESVGRSYTDLGMYISQKIIARVHVINVPPDLYQIKAGQVVMIPAGYTVNISQSNVVAFECSRIEVTGNGVLNIDHSVLTACNNWDGILFNGKNTQGIISQCGISNAVVGIYRYYGNYVSGQSTQITINNFYNNNMHIAILGTNPADTALLDTTNHIYGNRLLSLATIKCGTYSLYALLKSYTGGTYNSYIYVSGKKGGFVRTISNYFYGVDLNASRVTAFRGKFFRDCIFQYNFYRGNFRSGVDIEDAYGLQCLNEDMNDNHTEYGYRIVNPQNNLTMRFEYCTIQNSNPSNIAGISLKNCNYSSVENNLISGYTNGIEFFSNVYLPFDLNDYGLASTIAYNIIEPLRSGVVVSYDKDPYSATLGDNNYPANYYIGVWIKCNLTLGGNYGILGSGRLVDQIYKPFPLPTPPSYTDPANVFSSVQNWDVIWDHSYIGGTAFIYYAPLAHMPNVSNPSPNAVVLNGHNKGVGFTNDFLIANTTPPLGLSVNQLSCAPSPPNPDQSTQVYTSLKEALTAQDKTISIYPNPSYESFVVDFKNKDVDGVDIIDVLGNQVYNVTSINSKEKLVIYSGNWKPGVYIIRLYKGNEAVLTQKLLRGN